MNRIIRILITVLAIICIAVMLKFWTLAVACALIVASSLFVAFVLPYKIIMRIFRWQTKSAYVGMVHPFKVKVMWNPSGIVPSGKIQRHENHHISQITKNGRLKFIVLYLTYLIWYGYEDNPFEVEAGQAENHI